MFILEDKEFVQVSMAYGALSKECKKILAFLILNGDVFEGSQRELATELKLEPCRISNGVRCLHSLGVIQVQNQRRGVSMEYILLRENWMEKLIEGAKE